MAEQTDKLQGIAIYNELEAGLAVMRGKFKELPDVKTKAGYNIVKENLKEYRDITKKVEEVRLSEGRVHREKVAKIKADRIIEDQSIKEHINNVNDKAVEIMEVVDEVFKPHKEAKKAEDNRTIEEKRLKEEAAQKRIEKHKASIDEIRNNYIEAVSMSAGEVAEMAVRMESMIINEKTFEEFEVEANALRSAIVGKLQMLLESKKTQEETEQRLAAADKANKDREEQQSKDDAARKAEQDKADADRKAKQEVEDKERQEAIEKENAEMKAKLAEMEAKQKETDEAAAKVKADADKVIAEAKRLKEEAERIESEAKEAADLKVKEDADRVAKEAADKAEQERKDKEAAEAKEVKEVAEKQAKEEAVKRREQLETVLKGYIGTRTANAIKKLIDAIENNEIPYVRIDWTQK